METIIICAVAVHDNFESMGFHLTINTVVVANSHIYWIFVFMSNFIVVSLMRMASSVK